VPPQLIPKSFATGSLIAHIVCSKFEDALPLYRQEKIFGRLGIDLPRQTMCGWLIKVADQAPPTPIRTVPLLLTQRGPGIARQFVADSYCQG
jgi:transposase